MFLRFQFSLGDSIEISSQRSSLNISHATKRQKLEAGYFSNVCGNFYFYIYFYFVSVLYKSPACSCLY